jgi:hypothetical protein
VLTVDSLVLEGTLLRGLSLEETHPSPILQLLTAHTHKNLYTADIFDVYVGGK